MLLPTNCGYMGWPLRPLRQPDPPASDWQFIGYQGKVHFIIKSKLFRDTKPSKCLVIRDVLPWKINDAFWSQTPPSSGLQERPAVRRPRGRSEEMRLTPVSGGVLPGLTAHVCFVWECRMCPPGSHPCSQSRLCRLRWPQWVYTAADLYQETLVFSVIESGCVKNTLVFNQILKLLKTMSSLLTVFSDSATLYSKGPVRLFLGLTHNFIILCYFL